MIMSGSFLPSLGRQATKVYSGPGSQHCYEIKANPRAFQSFDLESRNKNSTLQFDNA